MSEKVRIGMVGCGGMAGAHRNGYKTLWEKKIRDFEIAATCDVDEARATKMADEVETFQGTRPEVYTRLEDLLEKEHELTAVDVCTLHRNHHTLAIPCMEKGLHVTIEKPLAITLRAGKMILDVAKKADVVFQVAENYRRSPEQRAIRWAIREGRIGAPRMIYWVDVGERLWYWTWRDHREQAGGGWSLDGGVHFADLFRFHIGPIRELYAGVNAYHPIRYGKPDTMEEPIEVDVEDTTIAVLWFENGALGQWTSTSAAPGHNFNQRAVYGDRGSIRWGEGLKSRTEEVPMERLVEQYRASLSEEESERLFPRGITETVATELYEFIGCILYGTSIETDGMEGYKAEAISIALYESAHLNRPVTLAEVENLEVESYQAQINQGLGIVGGERLEAGG